MQEMQDTQVWSVSWEDPLEEEMATHSSILAWKIPWTEEPGGLQSMGLQRVRQDWMTEHRTLSRVPCSIELVLIRYVFYTCCCEVASVVSDSVRPQRRQPTRLPCPWDSLGKSTGVGCHFLLQCMKVKSESEVTQSCPTPSDPMDCSLPGSSALGIFQARVLEWGAIAFSGLLYIVVYKCWYQSPNPSHSPFPFDIHMFSMSVSLFLLCKQVHLYHFSRFHIYALIYHVCFSLSDFTLWQFLGPSVSLQMAQFPFHVRVIFHCIYVPQNWCSYSKRQ